MEIGTLTGDSVRANAAAIVDAYANKARSHEKPGSLDYGSSKATISKMGAHLAELDAELRQVADSKERSKAQRGLRDVGILLGTIAPQPLGELSVKLADRRPADPTIVSRFFATADSVREADLDLEGFTRQFNDIFSDERGDEFLTQARQIAELSGTKEDRKAAFDALLRETKEAIAADKGVRDDKLDELFDKLDYQETLAKKKAVLDKLA